MPEHHPYENDEIVNPETRHEKSDVNVRALLLFVVVFVIFAVVSHLGLALLFRGFVAYQRKHAAKPMTQVAKAPDASVPGSQPLLQPFPRKDAKQQVIPPYRATPVIDLAQMRRAEDQALGNYGWVDQQKGEVRLPIEVAKELVLQRGLPLQSQLPVPAAAPAAAAGVTPRPPAVPSQAGANPASSNQKQTTATGARPR